MHKTLIAGLMAAVAVPLLAQAPAPPPVPMAPRAPTASMMPGADKVMTRGEVTAKVQAQFAKRDANRDGFIAADEMGRGRDGMKMRDGMKKRAGAMGDPTQAFDRIDANRDGMISRDEFAKGREMRIERRVEMKGAPGADGARRMHRMGGMGGMGMMKMHMLKMADANKDGRISLQEATTGALQHFDMLDTNRDGRVTPDEHRAMRGKMPMQKAG